MALFRDDIEKPPIVSACELLLALAATACALFNWQAALADDWYTLETAHFLIHYEPPAEELAKRTAGIAERIHETVSGRLNWEPRDKTHLVLSDSADLPNAFVTPFPYNRSVLFLSPPISENALSLMDYHDWWAQRLLHEYAHVVHIDKGHGFIAGMRHAFGRVPLFFPNALNTAWVIEGLATHYETDDEAGTGRGQSAYYKMLMRAELASGFKPVRQLNLPLSAWPGRRSWYLYGVFFFRFMESRYGEGAGERWIENYSDNFIPWRVGGILEQETGKDIETLWLEFEQWLRTELALDAPATPGRRLTRHGNFTHSLSAGANGELYYLREDRLAPPALMRIGADGKAQELVELHTSAAIDAHRSGIAVVQPEVCGGSDTNLYYDLYLYRFDSGKLERKTRCQRLVQVSWHPNGEQFAAVQLQTALTSIVLVDRDGNVGDTLWPAEDGIDIAEIDWSPDGSSLVAARHHRGQGWKIEQLDLSAGRWRTLRDDPFVKAFPRFSQDGQTVSFATEASGRFQVHAIDLRSGRERRLTEAEYGGFSHAWLEDREEVVYVGYMPGGYDLFRVAQGDYPVAPAPVATAHFESPPAAVPFDRREYSPWSSLAPRWWLPAIGYTEESLELGFVTGGNDALGDHRYALGLAWDFDNEYGTGAATYGYKDKLLLSASSFNDIDFDDGDVERIQREDSASATLLYPVYSLSGSWLPFIGAASSYESDRFVADGVAARDNRRDYLAGVGVVYISAEQRARAISPGDGRAVKLVAESSDLYDSDYSGNVYTLDWREYLRLGASAHVLGLRYVHGYGEEDPRPFRLGSVQASAGLLSILEGEVGPFINQRRYTLRGYERSSEGRRMQLATLDWRFPISTVERGFMSPPAGLLDVSGSLFVEGGNTWNDGSEPEEYRSSAGVEVLAEINLFYALNLDLRVGYAHGFDDGGEDQFYLTLGGAF